MHFRLKQSNAVLYGQAVNDQNEIYDKETTKTAALLAQFNQFNGVIDAFG